MYLLDTNVISELRRPEKTNRNVAAWVRSVPAASCFLSTVCILEIEIGTLMLARRDRARAAALRAWIDGQLLPQFEGRIIPVDTMVAQRCATLHVPDSRPERDAMIAATALVHSLTVVTRNQADFEGTGVVLINPWQHQTG